MRILLLSLVVFACWTCKPQMSQLLEQVNSDDACSEQNVAAWIKEVSELEPDLITAQRFYDNIGRDGNCMLKRNSCEKKCNGDFWGVMKIWYKDQFAMCMDGCIDTFGNCIQARKNDQRLTNEPPTDVIATLGDRKTQVARREELLRQLHSCTRDSATQLGRGRRMEQLGSRSQEFDALIAQWKASEERDPWVFVTFRFAGSTFIDSPARRSDQSFATWEQQMKSDKVLSRTGLAVADIGFTVLGAFVHAVDYAFRSGMPGNKFENGSADFGDMAASGMYLQRIVDSCTNARDVCTAISCLGHRTQEILSTRDNLANVKALATTDDGRDFAVCRHYAPTFKEVCNMWALKTGHQDRMECGATGSVSTMHAWPTVILRKGGKKYEYVYDVLNDPFTPDLIPTSPAAEEAVRLPCDF